MHKSNSNQSRVIVNIQPGPVTLVQRQAWRKFWQKLIAKEAKLAKILEVK